MYCGVIGSRNSQPTGSPSARTSSSSAAAMRRPALTSPESSRWGSLISPFHPVVVRGFSKYTRIATSRSSRSSLAFSARRSAYSSRGLGDRARCTVRRSPGAGRPRDRGPRWPPHGHGARHPPRLGGAGAPRAARSAVLSGSIRSIRRSRIRSTSGFITTIIVRLRPLRVAARSRGHAMAPTASGGWFEFLGQALRPGGRLAKSPIPRIGVLTGATGNRKGGRAKGQQATHYERF